MSLSLDFTEALSEAGMHSWRRRGRDYKPLGRLGVMDVVSNSLKILSDIQITGRHVFYEP